MQLPFQLMNLLLQVLYLALRSLSVGTLGLKVLCVDEDLMEEKQKQNKKEPLVSPNMSQETQNQTLTQTTM